MEIRRVFMTLAFLALAGWSLTTVHAQVSQSQLKTEGDEPLLREWIKVLASDEFGGRKPMTPFEDKTVNYLARQLEEIGLEPAFDGSWFQPFNMIAVTAKPVGNKLMVSGKKKRELRYPDDAVVWTARATDQVNLRQAEYVFCGFGINAPEYGWNDYEGIDVKMRVTYNIQQTQNVGGILRGSEADDEVVVMSAHWDHLGIGKPDERGDTIYNGAADNASGMAGALLTAKKMKALPQPRRSVLFLFPSSEESGLFGSEYYCAHPAIEMKKTVACLNFESIGPAELTRDVVILGGGESPLDNYYIAVAAAQGRYIFFDDDNSDGWFFRSDHYNFVKKGVPAVVLENGQHPVDVSKPNKYPMPVWYHKPSDEYHEDWDLGGTLANVNLLFSVALSLANGY